MNDPSKHRPVAVTVISRGVMSAAFIVHHSGLDKAAGTVSIVGAKATIPGRRVGDAILVRRDDGRLIAARLTHIHAKHDRYRASALTDELNGSCVAIAGGFDRLAHENVCVADPLQSRTPHESGGIGQ